MYGCESWTIKKAEYQRMDAFELWCWRRLLRVSWTARRSNQSILKKSTLNIDWKDWCWSWSSNTLATWCEEPALWKRPWCWERLKAGGEGDDGEWDSWVASPTRWTWVWARSGKWWRTGKPGVLQSMGSQSVWNDWGTEQQQQQKILTNKIFLTIYVKCGKTRTSLISYKKAWLNKLWNACNGTWYTFKKWYS